MHEAYELTHLLNATVQIEAIAAYDGNLLLGTRQGHLLMYSLSANNGNQKLELQILRYHKNFSKKPIQQIEVLPEDNILLCLTDNVLSTYDINSVNFPLIKTYSETKGASLFALDNQSTTLVTGESNSVGRLCVAVRRKLQLYYGKNGEFKKHLFDFTLPDIPKIMSWGKQYLCVGFKAEYTLYDLTTGKPKELFPTSKALEPTIAKFSETSFLLGRNQSSVLIEESEQIEVKNTVKWSEAPVSVVWDEPFVLGLLSESVVVRTVEPPFFIQSLPVKARLLYRCKRGLTFAASVGQVWCLSAVDVQRQTQQLLNQKQFQVAINLTNMWSSDEEEKRRTLHSIQRLYACDLFEDHQYDAALREFAKLNTDPAEVVKLFPELEQPEVLAGGAVAGRDRAHFEAGLQALVDYLRDLRAKIDKREPATATAAAADAAPTAVESSDSETATAADTVTATAEVPAPPATATASARHLELIDTTLLKCYLLTNDALVAPLLRLNNCRLSEAERILQAAGKHTELVILYQTKKQHRTALTLLHSLAHQPDAEPNLRGYERTRSYLKQLGEEHIELIFKFSDWILREHPEEGLKIFTEPEVEVLPRGRVLDFLLRAHPPLAVAYLEHVIHAWGDTSAVFHDALLSVYRDRALAGGEDAEAELVRFLQRSRYYTAERALVRLPAGKLLAARAYVLARLGRHAQALSILAHTLQDLPQALQYCAAVRGECPLVYAALLRLLARGAEPPAPAPPDLAAALRLLDTHGDQIPPLQALEVLPNEVSLGRVRTFLTSALGRQLAAKRKAQLLKGLLFAEHSQMQEMRQAEEARSVVIREYDVCGVCRKRFNNQSAFVRYPTGEVVHYSCRADKLA